MILPAKTGRPPASCTPSRCRNVTRRILRSLLALTLLTPDLAAQQPDLLTQARDFIHHNDLAAADPLLHTYLAAHPNSATALYLLGYVLEREAQPRDSLAVYTRAAALQPPTSHDLTNVALDYALLEDYTDAIHWLERALAADPKNAEAWYALGRSHMEQGNFVEAERNLRRNLDLTPSDVKALDNLGLCLEAQNRTDEALASYEQAIASQAAFATGSRHLSEQPLLNLGTLLNAKSRSAEAVPPLLQSVEIAPKCPRCHEELARADLATGQDASAIREMEQAVSLEPKNPRFHYQLGQIYRRSGQTARADAELKLSSTLYGSHSTPTTK